MRFGSLFSGIGGMDLGLERAGMTCAWQVEIDDWCRKVLAKHWPDVPRFGDIKEIGGRLPSVDLVAGGFPCQPVSAAGQRRGITDSRWLWPEFARVLRSLRPRFALLENVPGLLTAGFGDVAADLAELGYDFEWDCIPATAVGAPHLRYRVFVVADTQGERCARGVPTGPSRHSRSLLEGCRGALGGRWATEPDVGRVAHGVPRRVDRLRGLGNAVVPQVAEFIGRRIMEAAA